MEAVKKEVHLRKGSDSVLGECSGIGLLQVGKDSRKLAENIVVITEVENGCGRFFCCVSK